MHWHVTQPVTHWQWPVYNRFPVILRSLHIQKDDPCRFIESFSFQFHESPQGYEAHGARQPTISLYWPLVVVDMSMPCPLYNFGIFELNLQTIFFEYYVFTVHCYFRDIHRRIQSPWDNGGWAAVNFDQNWWYFNLRDYSLGWLRYVGIG